MSRLFRVLVIINPGASRAEAALPAVSSWFSENSDATIVVAKSKKDRKRELEVRGRKAELIVIGGGDGTISKALPQLLKLGKPFAVLPLGTANDFARYYRAANGPDPGSRSRPQVGSTESMWTWQTAILISMLQARELRPGSLRANQKT